MAEREKLIELLADCCDMRDKRCVGCKLDLPEAVDCKKDRFGKLADHLIANGVTVQEWIPVTDRLPEHRGDVLVCAFWHEKWQTRIGWFAKDMDGWHVKASNEYHIDISVSHWMPLPEPPKEGEP